MPKPKDRKLTVITTDLLMFTMEAEYWEDTPMVSSSEVKNIKVYQEGKLLIAEFTDVRAVYFTDNVELKEA